MNFSFVKNKYFLYIWPGQDILWHSFCPLKALHFISKSAFFLGVFKFSHAIRRVLLYSSFVLNIQVSYVLRFQRHIDNNLPHSHFEALQLIKWIYISLFFSGSPWTQWHKAASPWPGGLVLPAWYALVTPDSQFVAHNQTPLLVNQCESFETKYYG